MQYIGTQSGKIAKFVTNSNCTVCDIYMSKLYEYNEKCRLCELCNILHQYDTTIVTRGILCISDLDQIDIIKKTNEFLKTNKRIPHISDVDPDAKFINMSTFKLIPVLKTDKKKFKNIKLFFTDMINYTFYPYNKFTWKPTAYPSFGFFFENKLEKENLSKEQLEIINKS